MSELQITGQAMNFIPYRKVIIKTALKKENAISILRKAVFTKSPPLLYTRGPFDYYAKFKDDGFVAHRLLDNMRANSFNPGLHGKFFETPDATELHVKIYPPVINMVLACFFIIGFSFIPLQNSFNRFIDGKPDIFSLGLLLVPVFIYKIIMDLFIPEVRRAEQFLNDLYETRSAPDSDTI